MDLLSMCVIIIPIKFGMQSVFIVDFMSIFFANILTVIGCYWPCCCSKMYKCKFVKHVRHNEISFSVLDRLN
jgi:hypothetical protein